MVFSSSALLMLFLYRRRMQCLRLAPSMRSWRALLQLRVYGKNPLLQAGEEYKHRVSSSRWSDERYERALQMALGLFAVGYTASVFRHILLKAWKGEGKAEARKQEDPLTKDD